MTELNLDPMRLRAAAQMASTQEALASETQTLAQDVERSQKQGRITEVEAGSGREGRLMALAERCAAKPPFQLRGAVPENKIADMYVFPTLECAPADLNCFIFEYFEFEQAKIRAQGYMEELRRMRANRWVSEYQRRGLVTLGLCRELAAMMEATNIHPAFRYQMGTWKHSPTMPYSSEWAQGTMTLADGRAFDFGEAYRRHSATMEEEDEPTLAMHRLYRAPEQFERGRLTSLLRAAQTRGDLGANGTVALPMFPTLRGAQLKSHYRFTSKYRDPETRFNPVIARSDGAHPQGMPGQSLIHDNSTQRYRDIQNFATWYWDTVREGDLVRSVGPLITQRAMDIWGLPSVGASDPNQMLWAGPKHVEEIVLKWADELTAPGFFDTAIQVGMWNWFLNGYVMLSTGVEAGGMEALDAARAGMRASVASIGGVVGAVGSAVNAVFAVIVALAYAVIALIAEIGGVAIGQIDFIPPPVNRTPTGVQAGACARMAEAIGPDVFAAIRDETMPALARALGIPLDQFARETVGEILPQGPNIPPLPPSPFPWGMVLGVGAMLAGGALLLKGRK